MVSCVPLTLLVAWTLVVVLHGTYGRRCSSPTLLAGAMTGPGMPNFDHEMHELDPRMRCRRLSSPFRTFDGTCNNVRNLGAANTRLARLLPAVYDDGVEEPRTVGVNDRPLPDARRVSRSALRDRFRPRNNNTLLLMQWGQFLDHDMTLMPLPTERIQEEGAEPFVCCGRARVGTVRPLPEECLPILFRNRDSAFKGTCMEFVRTIPAMKLNPRNRNEPREQLNSITAFIDASSVYGSSTEEEEELREAGGKGYLLKFEDSPQGPLLPRTERGLCRREDDDPMGEPVCFIAGDERVNEQPALATIHTVFLRLHNFIASEMARSTSRRSVRNFNETIFQSTRKVVGAIVQKIMYADWLPIILGEELMEMADLNVDGRSSYDPSIDPRILNEFSTAAYRLGHSLVPRFLPTPSPSRQFRDLRIRLRDHFLRPAVVRERFDSLAVGLVMANASTARDQAQAIDRSISRELTNHLFEPKNGRRKGQDLMALNIQRGRDHAVQPYNEYRELFGLGRITSLRDARLGSNGRAGILTSIYDDVDDIDLFVGGLSEPPNMFGGQLGETFSAIVVEQMRRLKFGDRFFFTHNESVGFTNSQLAQLRRVTASMVMCLTVDSISEIQVDAFVEEGTGNPTVSCASLIRNFIRVRDFVVQA